MQTPLLHSLIEPLEARIAPAFAAVLDIAGLPPPKAFQISGESSLDYAGYAVSAAGDVNGDGFDDLLVGAYGADPADNESSGSTYVIFGKAGGFNSPIALSSLDGANGFRIDGVAQGDYSGHSVSAAGDVNGDGFDDIVIGAFGADPGGNYSRGSAYVVFGKAGDFSARLDLSTLNGQNGFKMNGEAEGDYAGFAVSGAGDINGDGFDDILIGAPNTAANGATYVGATYVVFGKARGFAATLNLGTLNGTNGFTIVGEAADDYSGGAVSAAGDVNGDGFGDILIGAYAADRGVEHDAGAAYLIFGKPSAFAPVLNLSALNGVNGFKLIGEAAENYAGSAVSSAGDLNGDGFDDIVIGASNADSAGANDTGAAYVIFGKPTPFAAALDLGFVNGITGFRVAGGTAGDSLGAAVSGAGDINNDTFDDLLLGAPGGGAGGTGVSYVIFGSATSLASPVDVATLDGLKGFQIRGAIPGDAFGTSVSNAGDLNRDGFDDLLIGAPAAGIEGDSRGAAYLIFGRSSTPEVHVDDAAIAEGDLGLHSLQFTVSLDGPSRLPVVAGFTTSGGTATSGDDFIAPLATVVTFAPGETAKTVVVDVVGDRSIEPDETLFLRIDSATNATIADNSALGRILNDDTGVRITDASGAEGDSGESVLNFILTLDQRSLLPVTVTLATEDRTATAGSDYTALAQTVVIFAPGETVKSVGVRLAGDTTVEDDESFAVVVSGAVNAGIADGIAMGTIVNDETLVRIAGASTVEGNDGIRALEFGVTLTTPHREVVTVDYVVLGGSASAGSDYLAAPSGTLVFAPGETSQTISVSVVGDVVAELDETFSVRLDHAMNGAIDVATGIGTIRNDDGALRIGDASTLEGHAGVRTLVFPVTLASASTLPIAVDFAIVPKTATAELDYRAVSNGTLVFAPGETVQQISVDVFGDTIVEGDESFAVALSNATNATIENSIARGTILNDDVAIRGGKRATYIDVDGDLVTVTTSRGSLSAENFVLVPSGIGSQLALITLGPEFAGTDLEIRARQAGAGDGLVNVGAIDARSIGIDLGRVVIKGDLGQIDAGDSGTASRGVLALEANSLGALGVTTQLPGGSTESNIVGALGKLTLADEMRGAAIMVAGNIGAVSIHGDLTNGTIRSDGRVGLIKIGGDLRGTVSTPSTLSARGEFDPGSNKAAVAIRSIRIGGMIDHAAILAGYDLSGTAANADVRLGKIIVGSDWTGTEVVAGSVAGGDGVFGTEDDAPIFSAPGIVSRIASILVKGEMTATSDASDQFGIVAAQVASVRVANERIALERGAHNDVEIPVRGAEDLRITEVA